MLARRRPPAVVYESPTLRQDQRVLANPMAEPHELAGALVRLAAASDPEARELALRRRADGSAALRAGVAEALGAYGDQEALAAAIGLASDPDRDVRLHAIRGLGRADSRAAARALALRGLLEVPGTSSRELDGASRAEVFGALAKVVGNGGESVVAGLLDLARGPDPSGHEPAFLQLAALWPTDGRVLELARALLAHSKVAPAAIRHLAAYDAFELRKHVAGLLKAGEPATRNAAVSTLHLSCPPDALELASGVARSDADPVVREAAWREVDLLTGGRCATGSSR